MLSVLCRRRILTVEHERSTISTLKSLDITTDDAKKRRSLFTAFNTFPKNFQIRKVRSHFHFHPAFDTILATFLIGKVELLM